MPKTNYLLQNESDAQEESDMEMDDLDIRPSENGEEDNDSTQEESKENNGDVVMISKSKLAMISSLLSTIQESHDKICQLLSVSIDSSVESRVSIGQMTEKGLPGKDEAGDGRVIEGVFDGENMIGPDGKQYSVPANYASKSKLVEGDILKLTITAKGTFLYKQIGPIERVRVVGQLKQNDNGSFTVQASGREWKVLTASVTYYKGKDGDEIVILVPKVGESKWAAVENIVRKIT